MVFDSQDIERKAIAILKVLSAAPEPMGSRVIAQRLEDYGIELGERAVRYHLRIMDERGLTRLVGRRDGRVLTEQGVEELRFALVKDKVGFAISKIELLSFRTEFDYVNRRGLVPVNVSLFPRNDFSDAIRVMRPVFDQRLCVSNLVAIADEGECLGELVVPEGKTGLATVCSIVINGCLLKAGIPMDSRFGGILQIKGHQPLRFIELIYYSGSSLDPSEIFIRAGMTSVREVAARGDGRILANFREIPAACRPLASQILTGLAEAGLGGLVMMGETSEALCGMPMELNKVGMILTGGLNPVAAAAEAGFAAENRAMCTVMEYQELKEISGV
jgi:hypothetical protein